MANSRNNGAFRKVTGIKAFIVSNQREGKFTRVNIMPKKSARQVRTSLMNCMPSLGSCTES